MKKIFIIIILMILIVLILIKISLFSIMFNWKISFNILNNIVYEKSETSLNGDGYYFYIMKNHFKNNISNEHFKSRNYENNTLNILKYLDVDEKKYPDFSKEYIFHYKKKNDNSYIYIFDFKEEKYTYIIEAWV